MRSDLFSKDVPKMPEGYYSGDKPNLNLRAFVEAHIKENPYNPETDDYDVPAFDKSIETTKATAIYNMHTYWSKKPHDAIRQYICHYTKPGDLVLDPFCGSGGTALAALMEGRKAIAIDRSPAATFITKNYCTPVDVDELKQAFKELNRKVKPEIDWLYETRCDRCGGKAKTAYTVYSQVFQCPRCMEKVPLFDCVKIESQTAKGKPKTISICPYCYERGITEEISTRSKRFGSIPVLVSYFCESGCKPARGERRHNDPDPAKRDYFDRYDLGKIREIESKDIPHWYPKHKMMNVEDDTKPWGVKWRAGTSSFRTVDKLFTKRNLWAISVVLEGIVNLSVDSSIKDWLKGSLTGVMLGLSEMNQYRPEVSFPLNIMVGTYYIPQINQEEYVLKHLQNKVDRICKGIDAIKNDLITIDFMISTSDISKALNILPTNSVDFLFTDPPYAEKVQYGELNFVWEAWLGFDTHWHEDEIIVNEIRGKTEVDWANMMRQAMAECYRVLKLGRWLSLCYHDTSEGTWALVQDIMAEVGFIIDSSDKAIFIDTGGKTYNQTQADKVNKRDLVINFRKPKPGEVTSHISISENESESTFNEKVHEIISEYLLIHPGASKDRIYDEVVSRMVRAGRMEAHNFDELLRQVADEIRQPAKKDLFQNEDPNLFGTHEISRWYLKESQLSVQDSAETVKEDAFADSIKKYISQRLKDDPSLDGIHYSDLFEHYIYAVKDKPRRALAEWLPDYFFKTASGTWRLPQSDEEEKLKSDVRDKGTNRRIKHYIAYLEQGVPVPDKERPNDATLAEWIRQCKRSGLFEQGKLLFEKGGLNLDNFTEEAMVEVEEDYQVCVRSLLRK